YSAVDVRVIAATNRNLRSEVNAGRFRSDLFYRLAVLTVRLPPLRERIEDLPLLLEHLLPKIASTEPVEAEQMQSKEFLDHLARHPWPGNVRELRNYLERCVALREPMPVIESSPSSEMPLIDHRLPLRTAREKWVRTFERKYLAQLLG